MRTLIFAFFLGLTLSACGGRPLDEPPGPTPQCGHPVTVQECGVSTCSLCASPEGRAVSGCDLYFGDPASGAVPFHCVSSCADCP